MRFKVTKQFAQGAEAPCAQFKEQLDAKFFIEKKIADDAAMKIVVNYRLYDFDEVIPGYDPAKAGVAPQQASSGSQGAGSSASARPTPFSTAPRPSGMPQKWGKDEDDKEKK